MLSEARLENFWIWTLKKQHIKEIICQKIKQGPKMLNFGASKPRVKGEEPGPQGPPGSTPESFHILDIFFSIICLILPHNVSLYI